MMTMMTGFEVELVRRVSYHWRSELGVLENQVPPRLKESPLPWDWLFLLKKLEKSDSERLPTRRVRNEEMLSRCMKCL